MIQQPASSIPGYLSSMQAATKFTSTQQNQTSTKQIFMADNDTTTVKPFLTVTDGKKAVAFYVAALGATEIKRFEMPGQKISSVIKIENAEFYVGDEEPENGNISPDPNSNSPVRIILHSKKADELFENAVQLGATAICPMTTETDWRIGKLKDPFGHIWEIGYTL